MEATSSSEKEGLSGYPELLGHLSGLQNSLNSLRNEQTQKQDQILHLLNAFAHGQFEINLTGQLGLPGLGKEPSPPITFTVRRSPSQSVALGEEVPIPAPGPPKYALFDARTVGDVWREWKEGIAGEPALQELEKAWGHRWRPESKVRVAWNRRRVVLDELLRLMALGRSEEAAVAELEAIRAGRHLRRLIEELKGRKPAAGTGPKKGLPMGREK